VGDQRNSIPPNCSSGTGASPRRAALAGSLYHQYFKIGGILDQRSQKMVLAISHGEFILEKLPAWQPNSCGRQDSTFSNIKDLFFQKSFQTTPLCANSC
jgi:hypothetical protein